MISSDGLCYGEQHYHWEDIVEIGVMSKYARRKDLYCSTRLHPFVVELPISNGLSAEEVQSLFVVLSRDVLKFHPHIQRSGALMTIAFDILLQARQVSPSVRAALKRVVK